MINKKLHYCWYGGGFLGFGKEMYCIMVRDAPRL